MHKLFIMAALAMALAGYETARQDRAMGGDNPHTRWPK